MNVARILQPYLMTTAEDLLATWHPPPGVVLSILLCCESSDRCHMLRAHSKDRYHICLCTVLMKAVIWAEYWAFLITESSKHLTRQSPFTNRRSSRGQTGSAKFTTQYATRFATCVPLSCLEAKITMARRSCAVCNQETRGANSCFTTCPLLH